MSTTGLQVDGATTNGPARRSRRRLRLGQAGTERALAILSPLVLLLLWEIASRTGLLNERFFPAPTSIVSSFFDLLGSGTLLDDTWISIRRLVIGLVIGGLPALLLGIGMGLYRPLRAAIDPLVAATYPIPKSAILPLLLLIFGLGESSKIAMVAIAAFFPIVMNTCTGVLQIDRIYHDVGRNYGAGRRQTFRTIALPGAMPLIMTGVKLAIGLGLITLVIAEMMGAKSGLGYLIWNSWQVFAVPDMYVGLVVISILGVVLTAVVSEFERLLTPWSADRR
jgi:NitT/TauT family transport system permease protein